MPGSLEPTSGGGQYGLTADDYQRWFTATNSQHLRQIVLPDHYLRRNPYSPVPAVTLDIPEHGAAARCSASARSRRGASSARPAAPAAPTRSAFAATELVPGGYITSACSPLIYTADLFPQGVPRQHLRLRPGEQPDSPRTAEGERAPPSSPCARTRTASSSPRPTTGSARFTSRIGPDGAMYVLDFYREVIETPLSLPDDIKKQLNLESRGRGRIWRIAPKDFKATKMPDFSRLTAVQLADELAGANPWRHMTAQRLLIEIREKLVAPRIRGQLANSVGKPARVNLLWALAGLGELKVADVVPVLRDTQAGVRENAASTHRALPGVRK